MGIVWRAKARTPRRGGGPQVSSMSWRFTRPRNTMSCVAWGRGEGGGDCAPRYVASFPFALSDRLSRASCPPAWSNLDPRVACSRRYANPWTRPSHVGTATTEYSAQTNTTKADSSPRMLCSAPLLYAFVASTIRRYLTYGASRSQRPNLGISASVSLRAKSNIISHIAYMSSHVASGALGPRLARSFYPFLFHDPGGLQSRAGSAWLPDFQTWSPALSASDVWLLERFCVPREAGGVFLSRGA
jgi:hypothetical protein